MINYKELNLIERVIHQARLKSFPLHKFCYNSSLAWKVYLETLENELNK